MLLKDIDHVNQNQKQNNNVDRESLERNLKSFTPVYFGIQHTLWPLHFHFSGASTNFRATHTHSQKHKTHTGAALAGLVALTAGALASLLSSAGDN